MNILNIEHISKIFGEKIIFDDVSVGIQEGDKIGIVGINGTGKTTLLRIIAGLEETDQGQIVKQNGIRIAYLAQNPDFLEGETVMSYALKDSKGEDWQVQSNLTRLGIKEYDTRMEHLSGGQRRKVAMAKVLAGDFDVLLLDEPTNHLDEEMILWLEEYLKNYRGTIIMVTHDLKSALRGNRILYLKDGRIDGECVLGTYEGETEERKEKLIYFLERMGW